MKNKKQIGISVSDSAGVDVTGNKISGFQNGIDVTKSREVNLKANEVEAETPTNWKTIFRNIAIAVIATVVGGAILWSLGWN